MAGIFAYSAFASAAPTGDGGPVPPGGPDKDAADAAKAEKVLGVVIAAAGLAAVAAANFGAPAAAAVIAPSAATLQASFMAMPTKNKAQIYRGEVT